MTITQHNFGSSGSGISYGWTIEEFYITHVSGKITTERLHERKCFFSHVSFLERRERERERERERVLGADTSLSLSISLPT